MPSRLHHYSIATDPSTGAEQKKEGLYDKASEAKGTVKRSADERVPGDFRSDETSSTEAKEKGLMGKIRGIRVLLKSFTPSAAVH